MNNFRMYNHNQSDFQNLVERYRALNSTRNITSATMGRTLVFFRALLRSAMEKREEVRIVSGNLHPPFYNKLVEQVDKLLFSGIKVHALVLQPNHLESNEFAQLLDNNPNGRLTMMLRSTERNAAHFILVGASRYSLEKDHSLYTSTACFNNPMVGNFLLGHFEHLTEIAERQHGQGSEVRDGTLSARHHIASRSSQRSKTQ